MKNFMRVILIRIIFIIKINSENFEKDLKKLKDENETYIERYEYLSKTWLEYFLN